MKKLFFVLLIACCVPVSSEAALVVAACGTVPTTYTPGQVRQITVDTNGQICS